jgi:hypothetical protein
MVIKNDITQTECKLWNINKNINPKTKRKITNKSPIYKKFEKQCLNKTDANDIYKIVDDFCLLNKPKSNFKVNEKDEEIYKRINHLCSIKKKEESKDKFYSLSPSPPKKEVKILYESSTPPKKEVKQSFFKSFIPSFLIKKDKSSSPSIEINEINKKNVQLLEYFSNFNKNSCLELTQNKNQYLLNKDILLYKQIGSKSVYGIVYKSKNINPKYKEKIPKFVAKIQLMTKESKQELSIFEALSKYAIKHNICHFPILYSSSSCNNIIRNNKYPELLEKAKNNYKNYSIILYEIANGDYYSFINKYKYRLNSKIWKNIYEQFFISIFIYHYLDLFHADTHGGNFLYEKIKPGGCFHYKINNVDYYIENIGYKWMIWDYGLTTKLSEKIKFVFLFDYIKIFFHLMKYNQNLDNNPEFKAIYSDSKAGYLDKDAIIPNDILKIQQKIWEHLGGLNKYYRYKFVQLKNAPTEYDWFKYFIDNNILFSKVPIGEIISSSIIQKNTDVKIKLEKFK